MRIRYGNGGATTPWSTAPAVKRVSLQTELLQPGPPTLELIDLFDGVPQIPRGTGNS